MPSAPVQGRAHLVSSGVRATVINASNIGDIGLSGANRDPEQAEEIALIHKMIGEHGDLVMKN